MRAFCLALLFAVLCVAQIRAVAIVDDFNDGNNIGWTDGSPLDGFGATTTYTYPGGNTYNIKVGASPAPTTLGPSRGGSYRPDANYSQFAAKIDVLNWDFGPGGTRMIAGLLARVSDIGLGTTDGYSLSYDTGGGGTAYLSVINNEVPTTLLSTPLVLTPGTGYQFSFRGNGPDLVGEIHALSDLVNPLVSFQHSDATYTSGVIALLVYDSSSAASANHTPSATFDNYVSDVTLQRGDYNYDGRVDAADYVAWRNGLGNTFVQSNYDVWRAHFGEGTPAVEGSTLTDPSSAVPEPTALTTLLVAVVLFRARPRKYAH
jgi:hypothetical protein